MRSSAAQPDVLVLSDHPAAYLAALLLCRKGSLRVAHSAIPTESQDERLVLVNPAWFELDASLGPIKRKLRLTALWGACFLSDDSTVRSEYRAKSAIAFVAKLGELRQQLRGLAERAGCRMLAPQRLEIVAVDESAVIVSLDGQTLRPRCLVLAGQLPPDDARVLAVPQEWPAAGVRRYAVGRVRTASPSQPTRPVLPMSLDLCGDLAWAWALCSDSAVELVVECRRSGALAPAAALRHWAQVLRSHGVLESDELDTQEPRTIEMPLAGALERECVASRTLLVGPAGGFYSACGEDVYPNCWSAVFAAEVLRRALREPHLQDALGVYREQWGSTLGEYLRGPEQNLRFLLPLVYRNQVMAQRLTESILLGRSVIH